MFALWLSAGLGTEDTPLERQQDVQDALDTPTQRNEQRAERSREQSPLVNLFDMQTTTKIAIMSHLHIKATAAGACENTYLSTYVNTYTRAIQYKESLDHMAKCSVSLQKLAQHNKLYNVR